MEEPRTTKKLTQKQLNETIKQFVKEQLLLEQQQQQAGGVDVNQKVEQSIASLQNELIPILKKYFYQLHDVQKEIKDSVTYNTMDSESRIRNVSEQLRRLIKVLRKA